MKVFKRFCILFLLFAIYVFVSAFSYTDAVSSDLSDSVFRLHILANSDSDEDQALKLLVRDSVLDYMKGISSNVSSKDEVICLMDEHLDDFYDVARKTILENGFDYDVRLSIGKFDFPTKVYGDISLPAGAYDALRIEIGEAQGHNWWCVMFPPLCLGAVEDRADNEEELFLCKPKSSLASGLSSEESKRIEQDDRPVQIRFALFEWLSSLW